ncbi:Voltage-dependent calcium channel gamma-7 subunit, partial [Ophiophagus hannah]
MPWNYAACPVSLHKPACQAELQKPEFCIYWKNWGHRQPHYLHPTALADLRKESPCLFPPLGLIRLYVLCAAFGQSLSRSPRMSNCSSRALTLLSSVFGACGLLLVGIAVSTDYWLFMEEGIVFPQNQTTEIVMALHAGLWRVCFFADAVALHSKRSSVSLQKQLRYVAQFFQNKHFTNPEGVGKVNVVFTRTHKAGSARHRLLCII